MSGMDALRWGGFVAGLVLVFSTWRSIVTTIILPRLTTSRIMLLTWAAVFYTFQFVADRLPRYEQKDRWLALRGPIALLAALVNWMACFLIGFALMGWPLVEGGDFGVALRIAGSSFFTLGVVSSPLGGPTVLEFVAAASGMIVIALQIGYLPTIYGAYNRRETLVTALSARAGAPAWGPEVLARHQISDATATLPALFAAWETWAADITESHVSYPWLMVFRSPDPLHSWVISLLAMLDAAALSLALSPSQAPPEARQCLRVGYVAMRTIARQARAPFGKPVLINTDPHPDDPIALPYESFVRAVEHLQRAGFPIEREMEEAWRHFRGWRVNYEAAAMILADFVVAVPAPWSGRRRRMTRQEVYDIFEHRPRFRTPDDPEGVLLPLPGKAKNALPGSKEQGT